MTKLKEGKRLAAIGAISNFAGLTITKVIGIVIAIILTRTLSIEEFGVFNLFIAAMTLLGGVSLGLDKIIQRYFPMLLREDNARAVSLYVVFILKRYLVFLALLAAGYIANRSGAIELEQFDFEYFWFAIGAGAILAGRLSTLAALNAAFLDHRYLNFVLITSDLIKLAGLSLIWNGEVMLLLIIWISAEGCALLLLLGRLVIKLMPLDARSLAPSTIRQLDYRRYYNYGKYLAFASAGTYVLSTEVDYLFLSYFSDNESVGLYAFSAKLPFIMLMFAPSNLMFNVTVPLLLKKIDGGDDISEVRFSMSTFLKLNVMAWTIFSALVAINIEAIIYYVFDPKYLQTKVFIYAWFILLYALVIKNVFEPVARAMEYTRVYLLTFLAAVVNLIGNYLLIPMLGIEGALLATGLSFTLQGYLAAFLITKKMGLPINVHSIINAIARVVLTAAIVWFISVSYDAAFTEHLIHNLVGLLAILLVYWPTKYFTYVERGYILAFMRKRP